MTEPLWLNGYSGQTVDELLGLEDQYRTSSLVLAFEEAINQKAARVGERNLTEEELVILAVEALEREVNNGGYDQFFLNTPEFRSIIVTSLQRIGCPKVAEITQQALDNTGNAERLNECDKLYFEGPECIEGKLFEFIKTNRKRIVF